MADVAVTVAAPIQVTVQPFNNYTITVGTPGVAGPSGVGATDDLGWIFIQDMQYTVSSPLSILANVRTKVPNNSQGLLTNSIGGPPGSSSWYDPIGQKFHPDAVGDFYQYRLNITIVPSVNNRAITFDFDIGTANVIFSQTIDLIKGAGVPNKMSVQMPIGVSQSFINNGGTINLTADTDVTVYGISVQIFKAFNK